jgi:hypothetical protein
MAGPGKPGPKGLDPSNPFSEGRHYDVDLETGCWNWRLFKRRGYGIHKSQQAHRVQYAALVGPIPAGYDVHHVCENKACVNPEHLVVVRRGEHAQLHHHGTLDASAVVELRERAATGELVSDLARERGLTPQHVWKVVTGLNWPEIGGPTSRSASSCEHCGGSIVGRHRHARYCSAKCQNLAKTARRRVARQAA